MTSQDDSNQRPLLFLCSGNVLRSAFCELYARHLELPYSHISSAGTAYRNTVIFPESRALLQQLGVREEWLEEFRSTFIGDMPTPPPANTLVYGMTQDHLDQFSAEFGDHHEKRLILTLIDREGEIPDPYYTGLYEEAFTDLTACIQAMV